MRSIFRRAGQGPSARIHTKIQPQDTIKNYLSRKNHQFPPKNYAEKP
jgi:hypothetical protein